MVCPTSAALQEENIRQVLEIIDLIEEKIRNTSDDQFVVSYCIHAYDKIDNQIEEVRGFKDIKPLSYDEAKLLMNEINDIKDLPNTEIKSLKDYLTAELNRKNILLNQLNKIL